VDARDKPGHDVLDRIVAAAGSRHVFSAGLLMPNVALRLSNSSTFTPFLRMI
jgi:hypothetical protein